MRGKLVLLSTLVLLAWPVHAAVAAAAPAHVAGGAAIGTDFNGDGFADLAVGVPYEDVGSITNAGAVNVLYGAASGLVSAGNQFWNQESPDVKDEVDANDDFGYSLATADFNGDGFTDLAVGVPYEDVGIAADAGGVNVLYGSVDGLSATTTPDQFWTQDTPDVEDDPETGDLFGWAVSTGDFDGDGFSDLAIGVPSEDLGTVADAGAVEVLYGSAAGLTAADDQFWTQDSSGVPDVAEAGDDVGTSLAAGDFNGDGVADLALGAYLEDVGDSFDSVANAGAVNLLYGSAAGLSSAGSQYWTQNSQGVLGEAEVSDEFSEAVAAGDFNGDGFADLAIGVLGEDLSRGSDGGAVNVLFGSTRGLATPHNQFINQDSQGILDQVESSDQFGAALSAGNFDGDPFDDLAIGVPNEEVLRVNQAGMAQVIYGSGSGLSTRDQVWAQDSPLIQGDGETADEMGSAVATGDYNGDGFSDLTAGVPLEGVDPNGDTGAVNTIYGSFAGLSAAGNDFWSQDNPGILDDSEVSDQFGFSIG